MRHLGEISHHRKKENAEMSIHIHKTEVAETTWILKIEG